MVHNLWSVSIILHGMSMLWLSICSQEGTLKGFLRSLVQRSHFYRLLFSFLALLSQSKLSKNQLPTSFGLCYDDHLWSSVIGSLNVSNPTTINSQFIRLNNFKLYQFIRPMTLKTPSCFVYPVHPRKHEVRFNWQSIG